MERIEVEGEEARQCLELLKKIQLDRTYNGREWTVREIYKVNKNSALRQAYR